MKRLIIFFFWACHALTYAQVLSETTVDDGTLSTEAVLENLDFTEVTTGLLIDAALQWRKAERYDGTTLNDANLMDVNDFGYIFATLNDAVIDENSFLPLASATYMGQYNDWSEGSPIPIAILNYDYHRFNKNAIDNNLISESGGQLFDVPNRPSNPYEEDNLFAATPIVNEVTTTELQFVVPSDSYISNLPTTGQTIAIDFGNGSGFIPVLLDTPITVNYSDFGEKELVIKVTDANGIEKVSHAQLNIEVAAAEKYGEDPDIELGLINATESFQGGLGSATVTGFSHCGDGVIRKPLIVVEGFNPSLFGERGFAEIRDRFRFQETPNQVEVQDYLDQNEYDLIFVDFTNGVDFIQRSAMVVKEVIRLVNAEKALSGSTEENVILGYSMGGIVGKYALLDFEEAGEDHETATLLTFDSPLQGANVPLGAQYMLKHAVNIDVPTEVNINGPFIQVKYTPLNELVPAVLEAEAVLLSPAARQMLYLHAYQGESLHDSFYAELAAKGTPQNFEMIGILNGAQTGTPQLFAPGDLLVELEGNLGDIISDEIGGAAFWGDFVAFWLNNILGINATVDFEIHALPNNPSSFVEIYEGKIHIKIYHIFGKKQHKRVRIKENVAWDSAPGGMFGGAVPEAAQGLIDDGFLTINANSFCFVPSISAADIDPAVSNNNPFFPLGNVEANVTSGATDFRAYAGATMNTTSFGISQRNQPHVEYFAENAAFILSEMTAGFRLTQNPLTKTYNYGESDATPSILNPFVKTPYRISESIAISSAGKLWVNRVDRIGFTDEANPQNALDSEFDLRIVENCEGNTTVEINNGGEFIIGEWLTGVNENAGNVYVTNNAGIVIKDGGLLKIENSSKLIIQSGAEVIIQSGGLLDATWNAQVIVESGGILRVENNGQLRPSNNAQVWVQPGGQLILNGGAQVQLWHGGGQNAVEDAACNIKLGGPIVDPDNTPDVAELVLNGEFEYSGTGYFDIHPNANVELVGDTNFEIDGYGKGYRFLKLSNGASLRLNKNQCRLRNGEVEYEGGGSIVLRDDASGRFFQTEFTGNSNTTGIIGKGCQFIYANNCDFTNFEMGISATSLTDFFINGNVFVNNSHFKDCATGIYGEDLDNIRVSDTKMESTSPIYSGFGVDLIYVNNSYFTGIDFDNLLNGIRTLGTSILVMNGGIIQNNRTGIHMQDQQNSGPEIRTIDLIGQATLKDNDVGIFAVADLSLDNGPFPKVTLNCARLDENRIGIRGRDLVLNIDAASEIAPNYFKIRELSTSSVLFQLCYFDLEVGEIDATNNFWDGNLYWDINQVNNSGNLPVFCQMEEGQEAGSLTDNGNVTVNIEPQLTTEPIGCGLSGTPTGTGSGDDKTVLETPTDDFWTKVKDCYDPRRQLIYDTYLRAYDMFLTEIAENSADHRNSQAEFRKIAVLTEEEMRGFSNTCRMLVEKSRSRSGIPSSDYVNDNTKKISTGCNDLTFEINPELQEKGVEQIKVWYSAAGKFDGGKHPLESQPTASVSTFDLSEKAIPEWDNPNIKLDNLSESTTYHIAYELLRDTAKSLGVYYPTTTISTDECLNNLYDDTGEYFDENCQIIGIWWSFPYDQSNSYFEIVETAEFTQTPTQSALKTTQIEHDGNGSFSYFVTNDNLASQKTQWLYVRLVDRTNGATLDWLVWDLSVDPCGKGVSGRSSNYQGNFLGKEELLDSRASVYPNPTKNLMYLQTEKNVYSKYQIVDVMGSYWKEGNIEMEAEETKIEVSLLPPGVYMIYLESETNRWKSIRFVVSE